MSLKFLFVLGHHLVPGVDELVMNSALWFSEWWKMADLGMATKCWKEVPDSCKPIIPNGSCICVYFNAPFRARGVRFPPT